ncbi:MAG TPA: hypothetical protein VNH53_02395 [Sphingomicrobium sp.]|jgi:hypothetical protein|nr:hypothetical protein [Sphingomicrobium sp.]
MPVLVLLLAAAGADAAVNPRAIELFEREPALMQWALRAHDRDGDGRLSQAEAQAAADAFRSIADGDGDGRVTPYEYARGVEFVIARYAVGG